MPAAVPAECVRLTVEVNWGDLEARGSCFDASRIRPRSRRTEHEFTLEVTNGRVVEVMDWPPLSSRQGVAAMTSDCEYAWSADAAGSLESGQASRGAGSCPDRGAA